MDIYIAEHDNFSSTGSHLLRNIQNNSTAALDLLVRESIQNSTDAALKGRGSINVDFNVLNFSSSKFLEHLSGIESEINRRMKCDENTLIEVRDSNTTGLTGPLEPSEVKDHDLGSLMSLIYSIGRAQEGEGAGGSWGIGKTVYFRVGIGLVVYYTRIKDSDGKYKSRLAACLIENEKDKNSMLRKLNKQPQALMRGVAWWGKNLKSGNGSKPITDERKILSVLKSLNIEPFAEKETGTSIIIPYINEKKLIEQVKPVSEENHISSHHNEISIDEYIEMSIQKWYAPRVDNKKFAPGRWLKASVNGYEIKREDMYPLFRVIQAIFNDSARAKKTGAKDKLIKEQEIIINSQDINIIKTLNKGAVAGTIYFTEVNNEQLLMEPPHNFYSPYTYLTMPDTKDKKPPIIAYTRMPGMIVNYETSGEWTSRIPATSANQYVIGLFIPNSENTLTQKNETITLEEYLRESERSDHMSWGDWNFGNIKNNVVSRIQKNVSGHIAAAVTPDDDMSYEIKNRGLGKVLADKLLPPEGFGRASSRSTGSKKAGARSRKAPVRRATLSLSGNPEFRDGKSIFSYRIDFPRNESRYRLSLAVVSESDRSIDAEGWEAGTGLGKEFPASIYDFSIERMHTGGSGRSKKVTDMSINGVSKIRKNKDISIYAVESGQNSTLYGVDFDVPENETFYIEGRVMVSFEEKDYELEIGIKERKGE